MFMSNSVVYILVRSVGTAYPTSLSIYKLFVTEGLSTGYTAQMYGALAGIAALQQPHSQDLHSNALSKHGR